MTQNIRWHGYERKNDGNIFYIANSLQSKKINMMFLDFFHESRNLRLELSNYGMNPFDNMSITILHMAWPSHDFF